MLIGKEIYIGDINNHNIEKGIQQVIITVENENNIANIKNINKLEIQDIFSAEFDINTGLIQNIYYDKNTIIIEFSVIYYLTEEQEQTIAYEDGYIILYHEKQCIGFYGVPLESLPFRNKQSIIEELNKIFRKNSISEILDIYGKYNGHYTLNI